ncbi:MAG: 30S ribosome-binding factor RbfA [Chloroflexi bacterium]|nr:30S ribosome-binding factor RbfA [Chloroflexota bacterium]
MTRRTERLNELIRSEISDLILREIKDPRLSGLLTITQVDISVDLRHAKVFVSIMGTEEEKKEALRGLEAASGFFRRQLRDRLTLRRIPELSFHRDDSIERGGRVLELLREVSADDTTGRARE